MRKLLFKLFRVVVKIFYFLGRSFLIEEFVIIAGYKARYLAGNNQYLFNYLENVGPRFKYYFYTKDREVYREFKDRYPGKVLFPYSLKTLVKLFKAKVIIITSGPDDISPYPLFGNKKIINVWHGIPIKSIGYPALTGKSKEFNRFVEAIDYFSVSAEFDGNVIQKAFHLPKEKVFVSGLCKNDFIRINHKNILNKAQYLKKKVILYAPTFRDKGISQKSFVELFPLKELQELLEKNDAFFLYRSHFNTYDIKSIGNFDRIISASAREFLDPQPLLYFTDLLITDYSSIFFDFLLMNRPIIFYNYDYDEYRVNRDFLYDYEENTPGAKVQTWEELKRTIVKYFNDPELDAEERKKIKKRFHKFTDGNGCKRTYELIKELL